MNVYDRQTVRKQTQITGSRQPLPLVLQLPHRTIDVPPKHSLDRWSGMPKEQRSKLNSKSPNETKFSTNTYPGHLRSSKVEREAVLPRRLVNQSRRRLNTEWQIQIHRLKTKARLALCPSWSWPIVERSPYKEEGERSSPWASLSQAG